MSPKRRIAHTNNSAAVTKRLNTILEETKKVLIQHKYRQSKSTPQSNILRAHIVEKTETQYANELPSNYLRPFESRQRTPHEANEIRKEAMKIKDGYYINKTSLFS